MGRAMKKSTYLQSISYDPKTKQMHVTFRDGAEVVYYNVHSRTVTAIDHADSVGAKFAQLIHDHRFKIVKAAA